MNRYKIILESEPYAWMDVICLAVDMGDLSRDANWWNNSCERPREFIAFVKQFNLEKYASRRALTKMKRVAKIAERRSRIRLVKNNTPSRESGEMK